MKAITKKVLKSTQCKDGLRSNFCVVLGLQWGHEGKHKLLNKLCPDYDFSCRFNGGTQYEKTELENGDELFILPSGIMHDTKVVSVLGNGVVVDSQNFLEDIQTLSNNGIGYKNRLLISDRANLVTAVHHKIAERISEIRGDQVWLGGEAITQSFKPMKMGLRFSHLVDDWQEFEDKYIRVKKTSEQIYNIEIDDRTLKEDLDHLKKVRDVCLKNNLVDDTVVTLNNVIKSQKKRILVEDGSSSSMDIDTGLYPFVSSYHTTRGAVCTGLGVPEEAIETTIGVFSAVSVIQKEFLNRIKTFPTHI